MLLFVIVQNLFFKDRGDFWCVKLMAALLLIPIIFYTYNGVIGSSPDWINIAIFLVCAALAYLYECGSFKKARPHAKIQS